MKVTISPFWLGVVVGLLYLAIEQAILNRRIKKNRRR